MGRFERLGPRSNETKRLEILESTSASDTHLPPEFEVDGDTGAYDLEIGDSGNFNRSIVHLRNNSRWVFFRGSVSFWGQPQVGKSWTAVVLTDSRKARIRHLETGKTFGLQDFMPQRAVHSEVSVNPPDKTSLPSWKTSDPVYNISCMDLIKDMYANSPAFEDPFSATIYVRHFVCSVWEEWISRKLTNIHDGELANLSNHKGSKAFEHHEGESNEALNGYQQPVDISHLVRLDKRAVRTISWAFRNADKDNNQRAIEEDRRVWSHLEETLNLIGSQLSKWMNMFAQRAARAEARSAGQLTKLATAAVPCSIVAAVFSMGGKFAAGEPLFPVFWAITLPVTFALLLWVLHGDIGVWWKKRQSETRGRKVNKGWTLLGWKLSAAQPDLEKGD